MSPEILNPESKVGTLNPKTFESGRVCLVNTFLDSGYFPAIDILSLRYNYNGGSSNPKESKVVVVLMAIDGGRWLPPQSVTGPGSLLICNGKCYIPQKPKRRRQQY